MGKLIFVYNWGDEGCSGMATIPFEYKSKDDFMFNILEKFNNECFLENTYAVIMDCCLSKSEINSIESCIFTLDEWFNRYEEKYEI